MEINVIKESKNQIRFSLPGQEHTFSNLLVDALNSFPDVEVAAYSISHPLIENPEFLVKVKQGNFVREVLKEACNKLEKDIESAKKAFSKLF